MTQYPGIELVRGLLSCEKTKIEYFTKGFKMIDRTASSAYGNGKRNCLRSVNALFFCFSVVFFTFFINLNVFSETEKLSLAIINIKPEKIEDSKALSAYGSIVERIYKLDQYTIIERNELAKYISMKDIFVNGPVEDRVAVKAGKSAGAQLVLITALSADKGSYFISMKLIDTQTDKAVRLVKSTGDFNKVGELSDGLVVTLLDKRPATSDEGMKDLPHDEAIKKLPFKEKSFYMAAGLVCNVPIPIGDSGALLNITVAPGLFFDLLFVFDWGIVSAGVESSFDYFGVKDVQNSYVIDVPVTIKADYMFPLADFYFFAGLKGGIMVTNYKTVVATDSTTGLVAYLSPEIGAGYCFTDFLGLSLGASFDMAIFGNWDIHMNVSPFLKLMYLF
jgi:hypothetical protein